MFSQQIWNEKDVIKVMFAKMSKGHAGAYWVVQKLYVDSWAHIVLLDLIGCYGVRVWDFYSVVCGKSLSDMATILYLWENNVIPEKVIDSAIDNKYRLHTGPFTSKATHIFAADGSKLERKGS